MNVKPEHRVNDFVKTLDEYYLELVDNKVLDKIRVDPAVEENGWECKLYLNAIRAHYTQQQIEPSVNILERNEVQPGCSYHECENKSKRSAENDVTAIHDPRSVMLEIDLTEEHQEIGFAECH
ncbi:unnamed protein product [Allacma fusca]|uniref:Uncharacterized protein n=1 Tax=Allacma fusca TaxID=39272 RepID=A0A8J2KWW2_9HEXA|nr:unnamed protein product [Allacma fusca]